MQRETVRICSTHHTFVTKCFFVLFCFNWYSNSLAVSHLKMLNPSYRAKAYLKLSDSHPQFSMENLKRLNQCLLPPTHGCMQSLYKGGFEDAVRFLRREAWMSWRQPRRTANKGQLFERLLRVCLFFYSIHVSLNVILFAQSCLFFFKTWGTFKEKKNPNKCFSGVAKTSKRVWCANLFYLRYNWIKEWKRIEKATGSVSCSHC